MAAAHARRRSAAMDIVVFDIGHIRCGLDILEVQEITRIHAYTPVRGAPSYVRGLVNMRGQIITLIDVRQRFGLPPLEERGALFSIIVPVEAEMVGLLVDSVGDVLRADAEAIRPPPSNLHGAEGYFFHAVVEMSEGLIALVEGERLARRGVDSSAGRAGGDGISS